MGVIVKEELGTQEVKVKQEPGVKEDKVDRSNQKPVGIDLCSDEEAKGGNGPEQESGHGERTPNVHILQVMNDEGEVGDDDGGDEDEGCSRGEEKAEKEDERRARSKKRWRSDGEAGQRAERSDSGSEDEEQVQTDERREATSKVRKEVKEHPWMMKKKTQRMTVESVHQRRRGGMKRNPMMKWTMQR